MRQVTESWDKPEERGQAAAPGRPSLQRQGPKSGSQGGRLCPGGLQRERED